VLYEYNAVEVEGAFSCKQTFVGKGAGSHPTGSAVLSDVSAITYDYKYGYRKLKKLEQNNNGKNPGNSALAKDFTIRVYLRFTDKSELIGLDIQRVIEEYKSPEVNFIIADVGFKSLFSLKGNKDSKVFVCEVE
jgi:homoserine dehydrogenase